MPSRTQHWIFKNNKYYYRLQSRAGGIKIDILIPLEIDMSLSTIQQHNQAQKRGLLVHQRRKDLLNGVIDKTYFEWINDDKVSKVKSTTLLDAINFHKEQKKSNCCHSIRMSLRNRKNSSNKSASNRKGKSTHRRPYLWAIASK